jgi:O-antigen ligase
VQGHSVTQRFEFWRTGWYIFLENPVIGIGTGDMNLEYNKMYERLETGLSEKYRLRAHNQYLNFLVTFGTLGFLFFLLIIAYPFIGNKHANSFLYIGFCIILYTSMLNEDTLETQVGVTLYAFFNAFFLYSLTGLSRVATKIDS